MTPLAAAVQVHLKLVSASPGRSMHPHHLVTTVVRQTQTGNAAGFILNFIAQSKNKTLKQTMVLSESDVDLACSPAHGETGALVVPS